MKTYFVFYKDKHIDTIYDHSLGEAVTLANERLDVEEVEDGTLEMTIHRERKDI